MPKAGNQLTTELTPELAGYIDRINAIRSEVDQLCSSLSERQFFWQPAPNVWSVAHCIDHLIVTADAMIPPLMAAIARAKARGRLSPGPFKYGFVGKWLHDQLSTPPLRKFKAPPNFQPTCKRSQAELRRDFDDRQDQIVAVMHEANGVDLASTRMRSPAAKFLYYQIGIGLALFPQHERRHLWQAQQLLKHPEFPR